ncbi:MAG TPA: hypothetical protein VL997_15940, partial [Dyella sp.]|nr:hypothetical protein [Dyella sp.]
LMPSSSVMARRELGDLHRQRAPGSCKRGANTRIFHVFSPVIPAQAEALFNSEAGQSSQA